MGMIYLILLSLPEILAHYQDDPRRHFVLHAGNARLHCDKMITQFLDHNSVHRAPYLLYSLDLTLRLLTFRVSEKNASENVFRKLNSRLFLNIAQLM
jgi:hypothetical protein